ncbi:MAG: hypothetical protein L0Y67_07850 [Gammaproteobacteria bacterium]|nr:hypothetical protein [Gammaproteobacteria bacterium]MCI0591492.1 hypothetical protein [Gammaproteobacteria bacterium]
MQAKRVESSQGWAWITCGWRLFSANPGMWIALLIIYLAVEVILSFIPRVGGLIVTIISPALYGGMLFGARSLDRSGKLDIRQLFVGFTDPKMRGGLLSLGGLLLLALVITLVIGQVVSGGQLLPVLQQAQTGAPPQVVAAVLIALLVMLSIWLLVLMAFIYAPPLVMFAGDKPIPALKSSFVASIRNFLPLFVFSVIYLVLAIVAAIPAGLGFLILLPVTFGALYCSYKSMYGDG